MISENKKLLLELIKDKAIRHGNFQLSSGGNSNFYIDVKNVSSTSAGAYLIGQVLYEYTSNLHIDAIGGPQTGAVPLTTAVAMTYHGHGLAVNGFWVRKDIKTYGIQKYFEGEIKPKDRVVIVDDVISLGYSALRVVNEVRELGCEVVLVLSLVDRQIGARELFLQHGIDNYQSVFAVSELGDLTIT